MREGFMGPSYRELNCCLLLVLMDDANAVPVGVLPHMVRKFSRRKLGRVHLLNEQLVRIPHRREVNAEPFRAREQEAEFLVEREQRRPLTARHSWFRRPELGAASISQAMQPSAH